jgi:hypothetical protein
MASLTVTFTINDKDFTKQMTLEAIRKSGFIANQLDDLGYIEGEKLCSFDISNLNIQDKYSEKVIDLFTTILIYLTTVDGETFIKETIEVSNDYENEYIDNLFDKLPYAYYSHLINVTNFMDVPSIFKYLVIKFAKIIHERTNASTST